MTDPREKLLETLHRQRAKKAKEEQAIRESMQLLEKVDRRRRENPRDRRRWDLRANDLEEGLLESRRRLGWIKQHLIEVTRKLESAEADTAASVAPGPAPDTSAKAGADATQKIEAAEGDDPDDNALKAAQRILDVPLFKVSELPLQNFVLAKIFCQSEGAAKLEKGKIEELTRRIKMYDRSVRGRSRTERAAASQKERRHQLLIRRALDKCRSNQMGALTLQEIDIIIGCYDMIVQRGEPSGEDARLLDLINRAIDYICTTWSLLETLRESMHARRED